jgi:DNA-directed RNA polymerase specialized sigma24 family protein
VITGSYCDCLVCRLEKNLIAEIGDACLREECRSLVASCSLLSGFATPLDLLRELHTPDNHKGHSDALLLELLKQNASGPSRSICERILLLAFIPSIHRTTSQIAAAFPSLARDDTAQHIVSVFLEFLHSAELQTRRSHLAFTIARKLRRSAFRWAIHESRGAEDTEQNLITPRYERTSEEDLPVSILLHQFLDSCEQHGWLSVEERTLLVQFKLEGISCQELALRNGHSAVAIQHRIQRSLDRLRRLAQSSWRRLPEQLELFPP